MDGESVTQLAGCRHRFVSRSSGSPPNILKEAVEFETATIRACSIANCDNAKGRTVDQPGCERGYRLPRRRGCRFIRLRCRHATPPPAAARRLSSANSPRSRASTFSSVGRARSSAVATDHVPHLRLIREPTASFKGPIGQSPGGPPGYTDLKPPGIVSSRRPFSRPTSSAASSIWSKAGCRTLTAHRSSNEDASC